MIKPVEGGFAVFTKDGKKQLSKKYNTWPEAQKRLAQIEMFKKIKANKDQAKAKAKPKPKKKQ